MLPILQVPLAASDRDPTFWSNEPFSRMYSVMLFGAKASSPQSPVSPTTLPSSDTLLVLSLFPRICRIRQQRGRRVPSQPFPRTRQKKEEVGAGKQNLLQF